MYHYFAQVPTADYESFTAYSAITRFLAAAHQTMLKWLTAQQQEGLNGNELRSWWHAIMEQRKQRKWRQKFFSEVLDKAKAVSHRSLTFRSSNHC